MQRTILFALVISVVAASFLLMACEPAEPEPLVFSVLYNERDTAPFRDDWLVLREYERRWNTVLDVTTGSDEDYGDLVDQLFVSGTTPDIVLKIWPERAERLAAEGKLLPVSDYIDEMPHFQRYVDAKNLEENVDRLRGADGSFYILPGFQRELQVQQWIIRRDLFREQGLPTPETFDDLLTALAAIKTAHPETTPMTASWGGAHLFAMLGAAHGVPAGWNGTRHYNRELDRWEFAPATEAYREMVRFLSRATAMNVLDPELFTQSDEEFLAKLTDGRAVCTVTWITSGFATWNDRLAASGSINGEWVPMPVPESRTGVRAIPSVDRFRKGLVLPARLASDERLGEIIRFLDWAVYSDEGMELTTWGVEDVSFERDGNRLRYTGAMAPVDATRDFGVNTLFDLNENVVFEDGKKPPEIVAFLEDSLARGDAAEPAPDLQLPDTMAEAAGAIEGPLNTFVSAALMDFIRGERSIERDWDEYILELDALGYPTLEQIWNDAWDR